MKYVVELSANDSKTVEVEADSPEEAVKIAQRKCPKLKLRARAEGVTEFIRLTDKDHIAEGRNWDVLGFCEVCHVPILALYGDMEADNYSCDEDGIYLCKKDMGDE